MAAATFVRLQQQTGRRPPRVPAERHDHDGRALQARPPRDDHQREADAGKQGEQGVFLAGML